MTLVIPYFAAISTFASYGLMIVLGKVLDFCRQKVQTRRKDDYAPLCDDFEGFFTRRLYARLQDCWNRPIASSPDRWISVLNREPVKGCHPEPLNLTGTSQQCLNVGSYNYLGFGAYDDFCTPGVVAAVKNYGVSMCSPRSDGGTTKIHVELEQKVAEFLGKEAAITCGMGFATNSTMIPSLVGKGDLIISDALNHLSIVAGVRASGAKVKVVKHNDPAHLEQTLRSVIASGQPRNHRPWGKILIIVEGIYSMEGEICRLPEIVAIKKKYKAYLYLDEAHSIGALGSKGAGVCDLLGVDTADVDIMMGTFTKSFGACGGYIAGSKALIDHLRRVSPGHLYATAMAPAAVMQCLKAFQVLEGEDGTKKGKRKLEQLRENCNWFRDALRGIGCEVLGDENSPVMPIMLYHPGKISAFSRECFKRNLAVVVVGFPATPLLLSRARICISASHTREDLEYALQVIDEVANMCALKYCAGSPHTSSKIPFEVKAIDSAQGALRRKEGLLLT